MCDIQCSAGIGVSAGVVGVMMTIICCRALLSLLIDQMTTSEAVTHTAPQIQRQPQRQTQQQNHSVVEMPIVLRIYLPQVQGAAARFQVEQPITKNAFEPLPV